MTSLRRVKLILPALTEATSPHWRPIKYSLFPPLGLATLAAYLDPDLEISLQDEHVEKLDLDDRPDLVIIQVYITNAYRAYRIADHYRARGAYVALGGLHVTSLPEEAAPHADTIFLGPGEHTFPQFLRDLAAGSPQRRYGSPVRTLEALPPIRRDLIARRRYLVPNSIVVSRGCPHHCNFCYKDSFFAGGRSFYTQLVDDALAEIARLPGRHLYFLDDHLFGNPRFARELFRGMRGMGRIFQGAATVDSVLRDDVVEEAAAAGLRSLFVGFETLSDSGLESAGKSQNLGRSYRDVVRRLDGLGIMINGSFVFGLDGDGPDVFQRTVDWAVESGITTATFHILTPYPGTALHADMDARGRIETRNWDLYDTRHVVYRPARLTPEELKRGYDWAYRSFYRWASIFRASSAHTSLKHRLKHFFYSAGWKKFERAWDLVIRIQQLSQMRPILEAVLSPAADSPADGASEGPGTPAAPVRLPFARPRHRTGGNSAPRYAQPTGLWVFRLPRGLGYRLVCALTRFLLNLFYTRIDVVGAGHVPAAGPLIIAANHHNSLVDAMLLLAVIPRRLHTLANAPLFRHPLIGPFLRLLGALPVHRRQDAGNNPARTSALFAATTATLKAGGAILIFPEGRTQPEPVLQEVRTGAARMLLAAQAGGDSRVTLLPVGLTFRRPGVFRAGRALVSIGEPIATADCPASDRAESGRAARVLTERLTGGLRAQIVEADDRRTLRLLELTEELWCEQNEALPHEEPARIARLQEAMRLYRSLLLRAPERIAAFRRELEDFDAELARAGLAAAHLSRAYSFGGVARFAVSEGASLIVGAPLALCGILLHVIPYRLTALAVRLLPHTDEEEATDKIAAGIVLFPLAWLAEGAAVFALWGRLGLVFFLAALLPTGFFALAWRERLERVGAEARAFVRFLRDRDLPRRLRERRRALAADLSALVRTATGAPG